MQIGIDKAVAWVTAFEDLSYKSHMSGCLLADTRMLLQFFLPASFPLAGPPIFQPPSGVFSAFSLAAWWHRPLERLECGSHPSPTSEVSGLRPEKDVLSVTFT